MDHFHPLTFSASSRNVVPTFNLKFRCTDIFIIKDNLQHLSTCDRNLSNYYYFLDRTCTVIQFM